jgi:hypothetical protein
MAWDSGIVTSASAPFGPKGTAGSLLAKVFALMGGAGVANWSFVENIPAGTGTAQSGSATKAVDVFKCAGSSTDANAAGVDFYIGFMYTSATGQINTVIVAEDYSPIAAGSNKAMFRRIAPLPQTGTTPDATNFTFTETYGTANSFTGNVPSLGNSALATTGYSYWVKLTNNFMLVTTRSGTTTTSFYIGLMDSLTSVTDTMPLVALGSGSGAFTRLPSVTAGAGGVGMWGAGIGPWTTPIQIGFAGDESNTTTNDKWLSGKIVVERCVIVHCVTAANVTTYGCWRGLLKSDVLMMASSNNVQVGDTITIGGNTWTVISNALSGLGTASTAAAQFSTPILLVRAN